MKSTALALTVVSAALTLLSSSDTRAQGGKATLETLKCGPASWHRASCPACKAADGKMYVTTKYVEAAIADAHEGFSKELANPQKEIEAITAAIGAKPTNAKQWTEQGAKNPEKTSTFCWDPVKAEETKPLKDKSYSLGAFDTDQCVVTSKRCYQLGLECRKQRDENNWNCTPNLQEFLAKDGRCDDSPTKASCDCQPSVYFKCGLGGKSGKAGNGGKAGKKKGKR